LFNCPICILSPATEAEGLSVVFFWPGALALLLRTMFNFLVYEEGG
jgi:hypothetical protein